MGFEFHSSVFSKNVKIRIHGMEQQAASKYAAPISFCLAINRLEEAKVNRWISRDGFV